MTALLAEIATGLHQNLSRRDEPPFSQMLREYDRHHALVGRQVTHHERRRNESPLKGTVVGLDSMGRLLLRAQSGVCRIIAGQVQM